MSLIINPGAQFTPEDPHSVGQARFNIAAFALEIANHKDYDYVDVAFVSLDEEATPTVGEQRMMMGGTKYQTVHDGRYAFRVTVDDRKHLVEMPGIPIEKVRYHRGEEGMLDRPRVFIDGSSWIWYIGVDILADPHYTEYGT